MFLHKSAKDLIDRYETFIIDLWGVVHDGVSPYPGVVEAINYMSRHNKRIIFLSNAPRRSKKLTEKLTQFQITPNLYQLAFCSGEATYLYLQQNQKDGYQHFGKSYFYIGPQKDADLLEGLEYVMVAEAGDADFAIVTGFDYDESVIEDKLPQIAACAKYNLPMICANPDLVVVRKSGNKALCAGVIAAEYEKMGGDVTYFGKPYEAVYRHIFQHFGISQSAGEKSAILAIGDGPETDILGANSIGIDSALIGGGILGAELKIKHGEVPAIGEIRNLCKHYNIKPNYIIPSLSIS